MPLFYQDSRLCDALFCDPSLIPVVDRFGISIGVGDATIEDLCIDHGLKTDFFLAIVNTFLNDDYFPGNISSISDVPTLVEFLRQTNRYYSSGQLPNIERHFKYLMERSGPDNNLELIYKFFQEMKEDLLLCDDNDEKYWFPMIIQRNEDTIYPNEHYSYMGELVENLPEDLGRAFTDRDSVEEKIGDLESLFVMHLKGNFDKTLALAVVNAVFMLHKDIRQNNRIRNRILLPAVGSLFL